MFTRLFTLHDRAHHVRLSLVLLTGLLIVAGTTSCHRHQPREEARVKHAFDSCQAALLNQQTAEAMRYFPHNVDDYLAGLSAPPQVSTPPSAAAREAVEVPGVDLLLRTALVRKVPPNLQSGLTLATLMQHITDKHLLNLRNVAQMQLGRVSINGSTASAEIYYQGTLTALRLPFIKEDGDWKIDLLSVLPSAELLMRVDRAIKGQTQDRQVEEIVSKLPSL